MLSNSQNNNKNNVYQVSELITQIQHMLEASYRSVWVEAEISSLSKPSSGHWYFSLKDENSQIRCAMFRGQVNRNAYKANEGDLVRVRGKVTVYAARGDMQMIVEHIEPAGEGVLQKQFEELKAKLQQEGLFAQELKKPLPQLPKSIGLITSATGAAIKDVLSTIKRRFPTIPVRIYPAIVQGKEAPHELISAIKLANHDQHCDVLILSRGGGSIEDLWCFNDESLIREIVGSDIPIVSAVGHEVDVTLADFAADLRAPTPTAAAEIVTPDRQELLEQLTNLGHRLRQSKQRYFSRLHQNVDWQAKRLRHPRAIIRQYKQRLTHIRESLSQSQLRKFKLIQNNIVYLQQRTIQSSPNQLIKQKRSLLTDLENKLAKNILSSLADKQQKLKYLQGQLTALSYERTLDRGYAIIKSETGNIVTHSKQLNSGEEVKITLTDGKKSAVIK